MSDKKPFTVDVEMWVKAYHYSDRIEFHSDDCIVDGSLVPDVEMVLTVPHSCDDSCPFNGFVEIRPLKIPDRNDPLTNYTGTFDIEEEQVKRLRGWMLD